MRRWRFLDPAREPDRHYRDLKLKEIDNWWQAFVAKTADLSALFAGKSEWDLPAWMAEHLQSLDDRLMWEFGPGSNGSGHRLVITPESEYHLRPLVHCLVSRAPELPGWEFCDARPPVPFAEGAALVAAKTGGQLDGVEVIATIDTYRQVGLSYFSPEFRVASDGSGIETAVAATEVLIGESVLDTWIGAIEMQPWGKEINSHFAIPGADHGHQLPRVPIAEMAPTIHQLIDELLQGLPSSPCIDLIHDTTWNVWRADHTPNTRSDYAGRGDLIMLTGCFPDIMAAILGGRTFYSSCYSRHGESFCYLKVDGTDGLVASSFADRSAIEDALTHELLSDRLGCVIGGGTGLRYSYIDLALLDLQAGIRRLQEVLQAGRIPHRAWLLFHDAELAAEWIGIYPDTPPPPGHDG